MTDLQTELATLIRDTWVEWVNDPEGDGESLEVMLEHLTNTFAERLASAFEQVGWADKRTVMRPSPLVGLVPQDWEPVYRFVRPESVGNADWKGRGMSIVNGRLVVGTMCHCNDPEQCAEDGDHWEFFVDPVNFDETDGTMSSARHLTEAEMRAIATVVGRIGGR